MEKRRLLLAPVLLLVALAGFTAGLHTQNSTDAAGQLEHAMHVELMVYRNGELVYYDPDDPATIGFLQVLAEVIASDIAPAISASGGATLTKFATGDPVYPGKMFVTTTNTAYSRDMVDLPTNRIDASISEAKIINNSVIFTASFTVDSNITIYGVGMYASLDSITGSTSGSRYDVLLFYDPLAQSLSVASGDVITVVYKIVVP